MRAQDYLDTLPVERLEDIFNRSEELALAFSKTLREQYPHLEVYDIGDIALEVVTTSFALLVAKEMERDGIENEKAISN